MPSFIDPKRLKPHPANGLFDPLPDAVYQALKEDIAAHGIHDALLVTPDFTLITGHHRAKAALELGLEAVPVEICGVPPDEAERWARAYQPWPRQLSRMELVRIIRQLKTTDESHRIAEARQVLGLTDRDLHDLDALNDLVPALQALVAQGGLETTAAAALAGLAPVDQQALWEALGEAVTRLTAADVRAAQVRTHGNAISRKLQVAALQAQVTALDAERDALYAQYAQARDTDAQGEVISDVVSAIDAARGRLQVELDRLSQSSVPTVVARLVQQVAPLSRRPQASTPVATPAQEAWNIAQSLYLQFPVAQMTSRETLWNAIDAYVREWLREDPWISRRAAIQAVENALKREFCLLRDDPETRGRLANFPQARVPDALEFLAAMPRPYSRAMRRAQRHRQPTPGQ